MQDFVRAGRGRRTCLILAGLMLVLAVCGTSRARAAEVLVLTPTGHARAYDDRFLVMPAATPRPPHVVHAGMALASARKPKPRRHKPPTVTSVLTGMLKAGSISSSDYSRYRGVYGAAQSAARRLHGLRRSELSAVIGNLSQIAATGQLTPSRLPVLFETLERNREWWTSGPLLSPDQRVEFSGSQLVWQYYPGQGIELQVLGTFGKADGMYSAGPSYTPQLSALLQEMIPLAVPRSGGLAWEYYFHFEGSGLPWTSAMSQATGVEALTRAYEASGDPSYLSVAHQALAPFTAAPPTGVAVPTPLGTRYVQYTFAPGDAILNAFLQALIGLYDYAKASGDPLAQQLFAAGDREAQAEVPSYDTGAWSLYEPGQEDTLSYHQLVTGFLQQLCQRTQASVYCVTAQHFESYLKTPPVLAQVTNRVRGGARATLQFTLSKYSHVGIVLTQGTRTALLTSAYFGYGTDAFALPPLTPGTYSLRLAATDLAGNFSRITGSLVVVKPPPKRKPHRKRAK
ncbi:MAG TPA: D-glucuronyl C5-epimerase family protein [Solirubrobacteraceae bacterium]|nr:D-glucuronyl C5-epimerase family protein [Solirubrobacteraceae bacterium]